MIELYVKSLNYDKRFVRVPNKLFNKSEVHLKSRPSRTHPAVAEIVGSIITGYDNEDVRNPPLFHTEPKPFLMATQINL